LPHVRLDGGETGVQTAIPGNARAGTAASRDNARIVLVVLSAAVVAALFAFSHQLRAAEALSLKWLLVPWTGTTAVGDTVVIATDTVRPLALHITPECTSAIMVIPCVVAFALFAVVRNVRIGRALGALAVVAALVFAINQLRIALLAAAYIGWGANSLWIAHSVIGTLISLAGIMLALAVQTRLTAATPSPGSGS
jgi:exosortase/archaeosortase family protein